MSSAIKYKKFLVAIWLIGGFGLLVSAQPANLAPAQGDPEFVWIDIKTLDVQGRGWENDSLYYNRLPHYASDVVPKSVWHLSSNTAGFYVRFKTNATVIKAKWKLTNKQISMPHFAGTGVSGLDLYARTAQNYWHWLGVGRPDLFPQNEATLGNNLPEETKEFMLYLPLYNGVEFVEIGIPKGSSLQKSNPPSDKPIVFYGTSITQGGCASRPGMAATAILGRQLDREIINLGFSGSGKMEPELAGLLAELDPAIYFIDCSPNMTADIIAERVVPFVEILRKARPDTPIVLAEGRVFDNAFLDKKRQLDGLTKREQLRKAYETLTTKGYHGLYYKVASGQLGNDGEGTVDGSHPTDLGFMRQADAYRPLLENILNENR